MRTPAIISTLITILTFMTACSSNPKLKFNLQSRNITIHTEPEGATVRQINPCNQPSTTLGQTPIINQPVVVITEITKMENMCYPETQQLIKAANGNLFVSIQKEGYETYSGYLATDPEKTLSHNIALSKK